MAMMVVVAVVCLFVLFVCLVAVVCLFVLFVFVFVIVLWCTAEKRKRNAKTHTLWCYVRLELYFKYTNNRTQYALCFCTLCTLHKP